MCGILLSFQVGFLLAAVSETGSLRKGSQPWKKSLSSSLATPISLWKQDSQIQEFEKANGLPPALSSEHGCWHMQVVPRHAA